MNAGGLDTVHEFLRGEAEERLLATGGQFYASVDGEVVLDVAVGVDGADRPVDTETLFAVYCAGKPAFVAALGCLIDEGELSLDDELGHMVDQDLPAALRRLRVQELLNHTSGLHGYDGHTFLGTPDRVREALLRACAPPAGWRVGSDMAYCQIAPWELLARGMEALTGVSVREVVRSRVLVPLGVAADVFVGGMTPEEYETCRGRLGINAYLEGRSLDPILAERNRRYRCLASPAFGNTASARGLGRLFEGLLAAMEAPEGGVVSAGLLRTMTARQSHGFDPVLGRICGYGYGFMVDLADHEFGRFCSPRSFGHTGYGGMTAVFADPVVGLVVAFHLNGRVDAESAVTYHRPALVERVYRALDLVPETADAQ